MIAMIAKIAGIERPKTYHEDTEARRRLGIGREKSYRE